MQVQWNELDEPTLVENYNLGQEVAQDVICNKQIDEEVTRSSTNHTAQPLPTSKRKTIKEGKMLQTMMVTKRLDTPTNFITQYLGPLDIQIGQGNNNHRVRVGKQIREAFVTHNKISSYNNQIKVIIQDKDCSTGTLETTSQVMNQRSILITLGMLSPRKEHRVKFQV
jgi:hypothetical protein